MSPNPFRWRILGLIRRQIQSNFINIHEHGKPVPPTVANIETVITEKLENLWPSKYRSSSDLPYLDCLLVHAPRQFVINLPDLWRLLESHVPRPIRNLGLVGCSYRQLEYLNGCAPRIQLAVVQNEFSIEHEWDIDIRRECRRHGIIYEAIINARVSRRLFHSNVVQDLATDAKVQYQAALYALMMELEGVVYMNGSTEHVEEDVQNLEKLKTFATKMQKPWQRRMRVDQFKDLLGENDSDRR